MSFDPFRLDKRLIVVTGASSGIGRECAISCSRMGARLILLGRDSERLQETLDLMTDPTFHQIYSVDLLDYDRVQAILSEVSETTGPVDGLINSAGISTTLPFKTVTPEKMDHFLKTNVIGSLNLTRLVVKSSSFAKDGGSIVFLSSVMGVVGENGKMLYSMTKGALLSAMRSLAIEFASKNIRFNAISPGVVETPMSQKAIYNRNPEAFSKIKALHPLGLGKTSDVANACIYLLSDAARWVTGTNLVVDGGYLAR